MNKNRIFALALMGSAALLAACGKSSNNTGTPGPAVQNQALGPNGMPINPNSPYLVNCAANQIRLQNVCRSDASLVTACTNAGGTIQQNGSMCRFERRIASRMKQRRLSWGYGISRMMLPTFNMSNGETIRVHGKLTPNNQKNDDWTLRLYQNGHMVSSAENGQIDGPTQDGGYFSMNAQPLVQSGVVQGMPSYQAQANLNPGIYGNMMQMTPQAQYILEIQARNSFKIEYTVTAVSCEDGRGNFYPCP